MDVEAHDMGTQVGALPEAQSEAILDGISHAFVNPVRSPILWSPSDAGLDYEDVTFPASDGVPLEGWFIPADSDRLVILNHPMGFSRAGLPTHLEPWQSIWGRSGAPRKTEMAAARRSSLAFSPGQQQARSQRESESFST